MYNNNKNNKSQCHCLNIKTFMCKLNYFNHSSHSLIIIRYHFSLDLFPLQRGSTEHLCVFSHVLVKVHVTFLSLLLRSKVTPCFHRPLVPLPPILGLPHCCSRRCPDASLNLNNRNISLQHVPQTTQSLPQEREY